MTLARYDHKYESRMMSPRLNPAKFSRGWLNAPEHRLVISSIEESAEKTSAEWFVELGVKHAGTSRTIVDVLNACARRSRLLGVDLDEKARPHWKEQLAGRAGPKCYVAEARLEVAKSYDPEPAALVPELGAAWILVDACHCRTCVEADIARWAPKVAVGGLMVFHDTDWRVQLRKPCQSMGHDKPERPGVYDAVMNSLILREAFHLAQALEGGTDRKGDFWEGTQVWRRHA